MSFLNTETKYSSIIKLLHWSIALLFGLQYYLIYYRQEMLPKNSPESLAYILLHKSVGITLFCLAILMLLWRHIGTRPAWPYDMSSYERLIARLVHLGLYLCLLVMPITGYLMSAASGYAVSFFGTYTLPILIAKDTEQSHFFYHAHAWLSTAVLVLIALHLLGALKHHFIDRNNILKRMLPFG